MIGRDVKVSSRTEELEREVQRLREELRAARRALNAEDDRYRNFVEHFQDGVGAIDNEGLLTYANHRMALMLGHTASELVGQPFADFISREDRERGASGLLENSGAERRVCEIRLLCRGGDPRWSRVSATSMYDRRGGSAGTFVVLTDITNAKTANELLRQREYTNNLLDTMDTLLVELDEQGNVIRFNRAAQEITGYTFEEICRGGWFETLVPRDRFNETWRRFPELAQGGWPRSFETGILTKAGEERRIAWQNREIRFGDHERGVLSFGTDVTVHRRAEDLLLAERDLGMALSETLSFDEALDRCLATAISVSGLDSGGIYLMTEEATLELVHSSGLSEAFVELVRRYDLDSPNVRLVLEGRPCYVTYPSVRFQIDPKALEEGLRAIAVIPICQQGEAIGCLNIASHVADEIPSWTRSALEDIASRIGSAIVRTRAEDAQRRVEQDHKTLFEEMLDGFAAHRIICDQQDKPVDYRYLRLNPSFERMMDVSAEAVVGKTACQLSLMADPAWIATCGAVALGGQPVHLDYDEPKTRRHFEVTVFQPRHGEFACIFKDVTEQRLLKEQRHHTQKLEAVGRLAAGIAHDLNNLLTPILGYSDILKDEFGLDDPRFEPICEMHTAGQRARDLVRQLLAFSRKQTLEVKSLYLDVAVREFEKLLRRTLREDIRLTMRTGMPIHPIRGDISQIQQVLMNLAVNAQDAMPTGGELIVQTEDVELEEAQATLHAELPAGSYVRLSVTDTGAGMSADVIEKVFEPFFTTKAAGIGTGLGLATVYGIVRQHGGSVLVRSEVGVGTTFELFFPALDSPPSELPPHETRSREELGAHGETVLIVEDNDMVRNLAQSVLQRHGYTVLVAQGPEDCLQILAGRDAPVHLMLTDVIMPGMNGKALFDLVASGHPDIKVVYMSGYPQDVISNRGVLQHRIDFLQKPFAVDDLLAKVRKALDRASRPLALAPGRVEAR